MIQTSRRLGPAASASLACVLMLGPSTAAQTDVATPDSGLFEEAGSRLVQIDVSVRGPRDRIAGLPPDAFELLIAGERIEEIVVDRQCDVDGGAAEDVEDGVESAAPQHDAIPRPAPRRVSLLFYFDQTHLTMGGRGRALDVARDLIDELVVDGVRAMIVSSGAELRTFSELTHEQTSLVEALDTLENDRRQWDTWATYESSRIDEILREIEDNNVSRAATIARRHMRDEQWRTERALHRFEMVLGTMADLDAPKAVLYFADTMRSKSGAHYMSFFGTGQTSIGAAQESSMIGAEASVLGAGLAFQRLVDAAGAHGLRFYTVQAEGLDADLSMAQAPGGSIGSGNRAGADPVPNRRRFSDARDSLVALARETGGRAFLDGVRAKKMAAKIREDLSCVYVISFDADAVPHDRTLPVRVRVDRPKIVVTARGSIVVQSAERRLQSRLMAAFAAPDALDSDVAMRGAIVPLGFANGRYSGLAQVIVPPSPLSATTWDLGVSLVTRGKVSDDASGRVELQTPGVPVVLEAQFEFSPGRFELVGVAHEKTANAISSSETDGSWNDPDDALVSIPTIGVLQPATGAFVRDGQLRTSGALALGDEPGRVGRPTAVVSLVCRGRRQRGTLRVTRELIGDTRVDLDPLELELEDDRCAHVRDLLPAGSLGAGTFRYRLAVHLRDELVAEAEHSFSVIDERGATR